MPVINTYTENTGAQGGLNVRADPADFGANVGAALHGLGDRLNAAENDAGKLWAANAVSDLQLKSQQDLAAKVQTADPRDPDFKNFANDFTSSLNDKGTELLQQAPNKAAREYLALHLGSLRNHMFSSAASTQAALFGEYSRQLAEEGISKDADLIGANPSNENFETVRQRRIDAIRAMETNGLNKMKWEAETNNKLGFMQNLSQASSAPAAFLTSLGLRGGVTTPSGPKGGVPTKAPAIPTIPDTKLGPDDVSALVATAGRLKVAPEDLASVIAYETGGSFSPAKRGGKGGAYLGLIQFGPEEQATFNVSDKQTFSQQLQSVEKYLSSRGLKAGDTLQTMYRIINGGNRNVSLSASDGNGTIAQHVARIEANHLPIMRAAFNGPTDPGAEVSQAAAAYVEPATEGAVLQANAALAGWQYLKPEQKLQLVRTAEGLLTKENAGQRAELERQIKDRMAMMADGKIPPDMNAPQFSRENLVKVFGPDVGGRTSDAWEYQSQVGTALASVNTMTPAQVQAVVSGMAPAGTEGYAEKSRTFSSFLRAAQQVESYRQKNPMQWAIDNAVNGVTPLNFDDQVALTEGLKRRGVAAVNLARNYGTNPEIMTQPEVDAFATRLDKLAPYDKVKMLNSVRLAFNTDSQGQALFSTLMGQVASKTPMVSMAANLTGKMGKVDVGGVSQQADTVAQYVLEGEYMLRGGKLGDPTATAKPMDFDDKVLRTLFNSQMGNAFRNLDAQVGYRAQSETYQAVKNYLVADMYHNGKDLKTVTSSDVERAVSAVTGGIWKRDGDTLMAPWGYPVKRFQDEFNLRAQAALKDAGYTGAELLNVDSYAVDNDGDGRYKLRVGGTSHLLDRKTGRPVVIDYTKPLPAQVPYSMADARVKPSDMQITAQEIMNAMPWGFK